MVAGAGQATRCRRRRGCRQAGVQILSPATVRAQEEDQAPYKWKGPPGLPRWPLWLRGQDLNLRPLGYEGRGAGQPKEAGGNTVPFYWGILGVESAVGNPCQLPIVTRLSPKIRSGGYSVRGLDNVHADRAVGNSGTDASQFLPRDGTRPGGRPWATQYPVRKGPPVEPAEGVAVPGLQNRAGGIQAGHRQTVP